MKIEETHLRQGQRYCCLCCLRGANGWYYQRRSEHSSKDHVPVFRVVFDVLYKIFETTQSDMIRVLTREVRKRAPAAARSAVVSLVRYSEFWNGCWLADCTLVVEYYDAPGEGFIEIERASCEMAGHGSVRPQGAQAATRSEQGLVMSAHLHVSVALVVRVTLKQLKKAGIDPYADESTYPDVAVGCASNRDDGPEYYLWAKESLTFIASSDGDERNKDGLY